MVKQEEERLERVSKRIHELEVVSNNSKLLCDMIDQYQSNTPQCDRDVMAVSRNPTQGLAVSSNPYQGLAVSSWL